MGNGTSCGGCAEPSPEAPNPTCPNVDKAEAVGDPAISIILLRLWILGLAPVGQLWKYRDPAKDCGVLNKCLTTCVAVIGNIGVSFRCQSVLVDDNLPVQERTAKGMDCPVSP